MKNNRVLAFLSILFFVGVGLLVFKTIYSATLPKFVEELNNSALGALLVAIVTVLLLNQQTIGEELRDKNVRVFEHKSEKFRNFIELLLEVWDDRKIDPPEVKKLLKAFYRDVYIYLDSQTLKHVVQHFDGLSGIVGKDLNKEQQRGARDHVFKIIEHLKLGLGLESYKDTTALDKLDDLLERLEQKADEKDQESRLDVGLSSEAMFWHFSAYNDAQQRLWLSDKSILVLGDAEDEKGKRTKLVTEIREGDFIFLYSKGYVGIFQAEQAGKAIPKGSGERVFMGRDEGAEGHIQVKPIILLDSSDSVTRDVPRLRAIQRIYETKAIAELIRRFKSKLADKGKPVPSEIAQIESALSTSSSVQT